MKSLSLIKFVIITTFLFCISCTPQEKVAKDSNVALLKTFPIESVEDLVEQIAPAEFEDLIAKGSTGSWRMKKDSERIYSVTNTEFPDNSLRFTFMTIDSQLIGVQQYNGQNVVTNVYQRTNDSSTPWKSLELPSLPMSDFIAENVTLPDDYDQASAYMNIEFKNDTIVFSINEWTFLRGVSEYYNTEENNIMESYVKYQHAFTWNGQRLTGQKILKSDYQAVIAMSANVIEEDPDGPGITEFDCPHGVSVSASSELPAQGSSNYLASNIIDGDDATAWSEGETGDGKGQWIEFTVKEQFLIGNTYQIKNGFTKSPALWKANNRVKVLSVFINNKKTATVTLLDSDGYQSFSISPGWVKDDIRKIGDKIRFMIDDLYKGEKYNDTLITYFVPTGNCG